MIYHQVFDFLASKPEVANAAAAIGSAVAASMAFILSLISLCISLAALRHQRKHNQLSVRPLAYIMVGDYEDRVFVKLTNNGTGPMIIKSIRVINAPNPSEPLISAMPRLQPNVYWTNFVEDFASRSVRPGGEIVLVDLSSESSESEDQFALSRDQVREALGELEVHVEYTDIYGSPLPIATRRLEFFRRTKGHEPVRL
jgi:hypothetical protein